ncbi:MAG: tRNA (adenosine(37)-N6)-threonylcarbamoyltransferase complex dimerization subunit type 1 TsaB [bacterium]|nr:tRNA (adenosine(37)-N6)-threonylcarbamoyltransferase complex dimerization subunit type 1 TsaB [bacterium]
MITLGIDTATRMAGIALTDEQGLLAEISLQGYMTQLRDLVPNIAWMLERSGLRIRDVGLVAIGRGPGSFTGLRIGMATGKGLAQVLGCPAVGIPTLDALALSAVPDEGLVCSMIDARHNRVYAALYSAVSSPAATEIVPGRLYRLGGYEAPELETLAARLDETGARVVLAGDGAAAYGHLLQERLGSRIEPVLPENIWPRAALIARIGAVSGERPAGRDIQPLVPLYIRQSSAEREAACNG